MLKLFKRTKPIKVKFNEYGQPIGKSAATLSNFLGLIARNGQITPLSHKDWRQVPSTDKNFMWNIVQVELLIFIPIPILLFDICQYTYLIFDAEKVQNSRRRKKMDYDVYW